MQSDNDKPYVVAVSGGVDSVVLLHQLVAKMPRLIVAHFDHGTRPDSASDAQFVGELARTYHLPFESGRENLGAGVSEEKARQRRYAFLRSISLKNNATLVTAHHADDLVETIAINLIRGTGWRGLAVLDSPDIWRPLLHLRKSEIINYAQKHQLLWREDSTNASDMYLRNRLRRQLQQYSDDTVRQLISLRDQQVQLKRLVDEQTTKLGGSPYQRYFFIMAPTEVAYEVLRTIIIGHGHHSPLSAQLERATYAIKTARSGTRHDIGGGIYLRFTTREFVVETA